MHTRSDHGEGTPASLSVVILSFGRGERFRPLIDDLLSDGIRAQDTVVVHNPYGRDDRWTPSVPPGVAVVRMPDNVGYGAAMNAGIKRLATRSSGILLLTHDTRMSTGAVATLASALESATAYGILGPAVEFDGTSAGATLSYGGRISPDGGVSHATSPPCVDEHGVVEAAWVDGCAMLVRTTALEAAGPLSARYFMYFEEAELSDRMRATGWRVGVVPEARARSEPGFAGRPAAYGYLFARNGLDWTRSHGGTRLALRFALRQLRASWAEVPKPGGKRFAHADLRRYGLRLAGGRWAGLVAGAIGSTGPPPRCMTRSGDIGAAP